MFAQFIFIHVCMLLKFLGSAISIGVSLGLLWLVAKLSVISTKFAIDLFIYNRKDIPTSY